MRPLAPAAYVAAVASGRWAVTLAGMTYRLYGELGSGSGIIEAAFAVLGVAHETQSVSLESGQQRGDDYARLNPQRKLPTLVTPAGEVLTESAAILLVLDERHPEARLLPPPGTPERAQALRWLVFLAAEVYPIVEIYDYPERFAPGAELADGMRDVARRIWRERWSVIERQVAGDPWLLPSGFCFTDVYIAALSRWVQPREWRPAHIPRVEAIAAAVAARPVIGPIWSRHYAR
jgi:glutathione S-transferase